MTAAKPTRKTPVRKPRTVKPKVEKVEEQFVAKKQGPVRYRSQSPVEVMFNVPRVTGRDWYPISKDGKGFIYFLIPADEVEQFERHWFYKSGKVVRDESAS